MDIVLIKTKDLTEYFANKFFKDKDLISISDLINLAEDLDSDKEHLEEELKSLRQDLNDNYRPIPVSEQVGISDRDFI